MRKSSRFRPLPPPPPEPSEALAEARALAAGAVKALDAGGHEKIAAEMLRRAATLTIHASWAETKDEAFAPEVEVVA
jgi:hypothetical protein